MKQVTRAQVEAVMDIVQAMALAIKEFTKLNGGVPSGELYAHLSTVGMNLRQYGAVIEVLENAKLIDVTNHWIRWTGPTEEAK